jgi:hypothetical protein
MIGPHVEPKFYIHWKIACQMTITKKEKERERVISKTPKISGMANISLMRAQNTFNDITSITYQSQYVISTVYMGYQ